MVFEKVWSTKPEKNYVYKILHLSFYLYLLIIFNLINKALEYTQSFSISSPNILSNWIFFNSKLYLFLGKFIKLISIYVYVKKMQWNIAAHPLILTDSVSKDDCKPRWLKLHAEYLIPGWGSRWETWLACPAFAFTSSDFHIVFNQAWFILRDPRSLKLD